MLSRARIPVIGFAGFSNVGKTTLLAKLVRILTAHGLRVGMVKHAPHGFDLDHPGKDSHELRSAGATQTLLASPQRWALINESARRDALRLDELLQHLDQDSLDCVLVEGFKHEAFPKIEIYRPALGRPLLCVNDEFIVAVASDGPLPEVTHVPVLDLDDPGAIARFISERLLTEKQEGAFVSK